MSFTVPKLPYSIPKGEWLSHVFWSIIILRRRSERMRQFAREGAEPAECMNRAIEFGQSRLRLSGLC